MKLLGEFTFLKMEQAKTKDSKTFLTIHLLDENLNSCKFFVFNSDFQNKLISMKLDSYKKIKACLDVSYFKDSWNVSLVDVANG